MFKRRNQRTWLQNIAEFFYPRSGWKRAFEYVKHRIKRLPDTPHRIALGIAFGTFVTFTPFFFFHFVISAVLAHVFRANVLAALLGTFVGNPLTFPFIAATSYRLGLWILGYTREENALRKISRSFREVSDMFQANFWSMFGYEPSPWTGFSHFFHDVFLPYLVGGIAPGILFGAIAYFASKPMIGAYQRRRKGALVKKFQELRAKRQQNAE